MPGQNLGPNFRTPFGKSEFLGFTGDTKMESFTVCRFAVPDETIDGFVGKILRPGTAMATITSTPVGGTTLDVGKIGVFDASVTDGRQTLTNLVGVNSTFLPWQFQERDVEVAVAVDAWVVQARCFEYDAGQALIALTDATLAGMLAKKFVDIHARRISADSLGTDETGTGW